MGFSLKRNSTNLVLTLGFLTLALVFPITVRAYSAPPLADGEAEHWIDLAFKANSGYQPSNKDLRLRPIKSIGIFLSHELAIQAIQVRGQEDQGVCTCR